MQQISLELQFELIFGRPYQPQGKGKIERFFETMNQLLLCELPGYSSEGQPPQKPSMDIEQLRIVFHDWLVNEYMQRKNEDTGETPQSRWSKKLQIPRLPRSLESLHLLLMTVPDTRLVRKDGIRTLGHRFVNPELQAGYIRENVLIRYDPKDVSEVYVFSKNEFVCMAYCAELSDKKPSLQDVQIAKSSRLKSLRTKISDAGVLVRNFSKQAARPLPDTQTSPANPSVVPIAQHQSIRRYSVDE